MQLVTQLNDEGFGVQLEHDDAETTWESHGYIVLKAANGEELVKCDDFQHNRQYRDMAMRAEQLVETAVKGIAAAASA